jgi:hypothetical protein
VNRAIALEDGVVAKEVRQANIGAGSSRERRQAKEQNGDSERLHGGNLATQNSQ